MSGSRAEHTMAAAITGILRGRQERFPALAAALGSAAGRGSRDKALDFGLARILSGAGLLIASRDRPHP